MLKPSPNTSLPITINASDKYRCGVEWSNQQIFKDFILCSPDEAFKNKDGYKDFVIVPSNDFGGKPKPTMTHKILKPSPNTVLPILSIKASEKNSFSKIPDLDRGNEFTNIEAGFPFHSPHSSPMNEYTPKIFLDIPSKSSLRQSHENERRRKENHAQQLKKTESYNLMSKTLLPKLVDASSDRKHSVKYEQQSKNHHCVFIDDDDNSFATSFPIEKDT